MELHGIMLTRIKLRKMASTPSSILSVVRQEWGGWRTFYHQTLLHPCLWQPAARDICVSYPLSRQLFMLCFDLLTKGTSTRPKNNKNNNKNNKNKSRQKNPSVDSVNFRHKHAYPRWDTFTQTKIPGALCVYVCERVSDWKDRWVSTWVE